MEAGQIECVRYLYAHPLIDPTCELLFKATASNRLDIVKLLGVRYSAFCERAIRFAVIGGHLEIVKWLHEQSKLISFEKLSQERQQACEQSLLIDAAAG